MNVFEKTNIPQEMLDKLLSAVNHNVALMTDRSLLLHVVPDFNPAIYEISFEVQNKDESVKDYYKLQRSVDLEAGEHPDLFDLIYYDKDSILNYRQNFLTMSDSFLVEIQQQYKELSSLFENILGFQNPFPIPRELEDMIDSHYYDGDNYYLRMLVGHEGDSETNVMIIVDPMLNIETKEFVFIPRYYIGHTKFSTFEEFKAACVEYFLKKTFETCEND